MQDITDFDSLPNDAVISRRTAALVLGMSVRSVERHIPSVRLTPRMRGIRVGDIRVLVRRRTLQPPEAA